MLHWSVKCLVTKIDNCSPSYIGSLILEIPTKTPQNENDLIFCSTSITMHSHAKEEEPERTHSTSDLQSSKYRDIIYHERSRAMKGVSEH